MIKRDKKESCENKYLEKEFQTEFQVHLLFWMAGDFVVALTRQRSQNFLCFELFTFESV